MKKALLLFAAICWVAVASAQVQFGIKGGINANLYGWNFSEAFSQFNLAKANNSAGFHVGAQLRVNTKIGLYIEGDALYNYASTKINIFENDIETGSIAMKQHNLDIPVLLGFKASFFRIYVGPVFAINLGTDVGKSLTDINDIQFKYDHNVFGFQAGIGFDILKKITLDLSYNGRFSKSTQEFIVNGQIINGKLANRQLWLSVGFLF